MLGVWSQLLDVWLLSTSTGPKQELLIDVLSLASSDDSTRAEAPGKSEVQVDVGRACWDVHDIS